jgi:hypothetical protein
MSGNDSVPLAVTSFGAMAHHQSAATDSWIKEFHRIPWNIKMSFSTYSYVECSPGDLFVEMRIENPRKG